MSKRLQMLEQLTASGKADSFAWYALGMEYRKLGQVEDALRAFTSLTQQDPEYLPVHLMAAQVLIEQGRGEEAKPWLESGIALARRKGDAKALSELEDAQSSLD